MTLGEVLTLGGVLLSAGAALERMRRLENSNRDQGRRIGQLEKDQIPRLERKVEKLELIVHLQVAPPPARPHRPLGGPFETHVLTPTDPEE
jgi:hypothetical protein